VPSAGRHVGQRGGKRGGYATVPAGLRDKEKETDENGNLPLRNEKT